MPKWVVQIFGSVAMAVLGFLCVDHHGKAIPIDLKTRADAALRASGFETAGLAFDGRMASLTGFADAPEVSVKAIQTVRSVNGVFDVRTNIIPGSKTSVESTRFEAKLQDVIAGKIVEFETASSALTPQGKELLNQMVKVLREFPGKPVEISGHTDAEGFYDMNLILSKERAAAVKAYLITQGIESGRLYAVGYGPDNPIADNNTNEGWRKNRRIEFHVKESQ